MLWVVGRGWPDCDESAVFRGSSGAPGACRVSNHFPDTGNAPVGSLRTRNRRTPRETNSRLVADGIGFCHIHHASKDAGCDAAWAVRLVLAWHSGRVVLCVYRTGAQFGKRFSSCEGR
jgi:hypothetical protein